MIDYMGVMPQMGYGTWQRKGDAAVDCVLTALEVGYRGLDTAERYGNEAEIGRALSATTVPRSQIFVTSKVWWEHLGPADMRAAIEGSLSRLGLDHLDLYLIHWPSPGGSVAMESYLETLFRLQDEGLTRHVGISNHTVPMMRKAKEFAPEREIATNQVEIHPFMQNPKVVEAARALKIPLTAYLPLAKGTVTGDAVIGKIAEELDATPGQVTLAFLMAEGHAVIPSSSRGERIAENYGALKLHLTSEHIAKLRALDQEHRMTQVDFAPDWD